MIIDKRARFLIVNIHIPGDPPRSAAYPGLHEDSAYDQQNYPIFRSKVKAIDTAGQVR